MFEDTRESHPETQLFYCNSRYYNPEWCRWISPDDIEYLDPESVNGLNLYCYCMNNPISYCDPSGHSVLLTILLIAFIVDTIVETSILMGSDDYKAEKVYKLDSKTGEENVNIPNSALFNNPIAQTIYANYLYKNVKRADGSNYFNGSVYDIIGEWQAHNDASKLLGLALFMPGAIIQNIPFISSGVQTVKSWFDSSYAVDLGPNINADDRPVVRIISKIYKWKRAILGL